MSDSTAQQAPALPASIPTMGQRLIYVGSQKLATLAAGALMHAGLIKAGESQQTAALISGLCVLTISCAVTYIQEHHLLDRMQALLAAPPPPPKP